MNKAVDVLLLVLIVQFIYTCIVWGVLLNNHAVNSILQALLMIPFVISVFLVARWKSQRDEDESTAKRAS